MRLIHKLGNKIHKFDKTPKRRKISNPTARDIKFKKDSQANALMQNAQVAAM
ncbi:hypothetical protein BRADI_4g31213v3 [Brachypodium distachyon]|uniref:Uncharacterized protein n=1 Tax=Brachypodium distachyon TaxID=15368 RepID=A0A2K2CRM2_BRADI|nr:hypothetical protein BRADI_4g31213v3 [Brachypodium distachyon]